MYEYRALYQVYPMRWWYVWAGEKEKSTIDWGSFMKHEGECLIAPFDTSESIRFPSSVGQYCEVQWTSCLYRCSVSKSAQWASGYQVFGLANSFGPSSSVCSFLKPITPNLQASTQSTSAGIENIFRIFFPSMRCFSTFSYASGDGTHGRHRCITRVNQRWSSFSAEF